MEPAAWALWSDNSFYCKNFWGSILTGAASNLAMASCSVAEPLVEGDLFAACRRGDQQAFRVLFETHKDRVYSFAYRFFGDEARAADLTQDVFVKLYSRIHDYQGTAKFETWLYRVVSNACIDAQRKYRRFLPWLGDEHPLQASGKAVTEDRAVRRQTESAVHAAIGKLSPALRVPVLLRYMEDLSYEEIGDVLHIAPGTVASRLNRAHKALAKRLKAFRGMTA